MTSFKFETTACWTISVLDSPKNLLIFLRTNLGISIIQNYASIQNSNPKIGAVFSFFFSNLWSDLSK